MIYVVTILIGLIVNGSWIFVLSTWLLDFLWYFIARLHACALFWVHTVYHGCLYVHYANRAHVVALLIVRVHLLQGDLLKKHCLKFSVLLTLALMIYSWTGEEKDVLGRIICSCLKTFCISLSSVMPKSHCMHYDVYVFNGTFNSTKF